MTWLITDHNEALNLFFVALHFAEKAHRELTNVRGIEDKPDERNARREMYFYWSNLAESFYVIAERLEAIHERA